ncbi:RND transporter [Thalassotalea insulae]|uniref:RND transporter n=2 Tax=Thalassotalea insulae TaxID=2056778 RepID=A0ABQ6H1H6_9GAMM|nr:RND transporter [Thalassotalea insulae]
MHSVAFVILSSLYGCASPSYQSQAMEQLTVPEHWQSAHQLDSSTSAKDNTSWLATLNDDQLSELVLLALANNRQLQAKLATLKIAEQQAIVSGAAKFPELSLSQGNGRKKLVKDNGVQYQTSADINLTLSYELDVWGKLSDQQHQAKLDLLAAQNTYLQAKQQLTADVAKSWFNLIEAQQLLALYQKRADNLSNNLAMIQSSYRLGLTDALDVYLTQNNVNSELARVASQQQQVLASKRALELLIGEYPQASINAKQRLPEINNHIATGLPAQLLTQRADLVASWYQLLVLDAGVAIAHKQRFPRFALTTSAGDSSDQLSELLSGNTIAWSLLGNITMPLFSGGKLAAQEQQAKLKLVQKEQLYLEQLFQAFAEVENTVDNHASLTQRYRYLLEAQENAKQAEKLSFDQYLRGLVQYTTVLESQRRSFDAQTSVIHLKNQLLQNRIDIHLALGGDFVTAEDELEPKLAVSSMTLISE